MKSFKTSSEVDKSEAKLERQDYDGAQTDEDRLLQIFPAEIWLQIVTVSCPNDLLNIRESSQFFGGLLTPIKFLFTAVLKCVLPYTRDDDERCCVLKNCRVVCHSWCKAVNSILQDESSHVWDHTRRFSGIPQHPLHLLHFRISFSNLDDMLPRFEHHFNDTHLEKGKNPFVSRHMKIFYGRSSSKTSEYFLHLYKILKKCGHHIWYLDVILTRSNPNNGFQELRGLLELLPNLKLLTVYNGTELWPAKSSLPNLEPFRYLPKLQCVNTGGVHSEVLLKALLARNTQVKVIELEQHRKGAQNWIQPLPNLERLRVNCNNMGEFQQIGQDHVNWPLKQLVADLMPILGTLKWQEVRRCFQILETKFGNTLEQLGLYFPLDCELNTNVSLYLPNLTALSLEMTFGFSLDFLLPMKKNLKYLDIKVEYQQRFAHAPALQEETIKFFTLDCPPKDTNIWKIFSKLEKLRYWYRFNPNKKTRIVYYREDILVN